MPDDPTALIKTGLPYLILAPGILLCLVGLLAMKLQIKKLREALARQEQTVGRMEDQFQTTATQAGPEMATASARESINRYKVLYLHGLGHPTEEIAKVTEIRRAEVEFIIKVTEYSQTRNGVRTSTIT